MKPIKRFRLSYFTIYVKAWDIRTYTVLYRHMQKNTVFSHVAERLTP